MDRYASITPRRNREDRERVSTTRQNGNAGYYETRIVICARAATKAESRDVKKQRAGWLCSGVRVARLNVKKEKKKKKKKKQGKKENTRRSPARGHDYAADEIDNMIFPDNKPRWPPYTSDPV